ncbi:N-methylhydantoinase A [Sphingomonas vulcanisoli]|uniref:N-methylhydantoinase A n=1 Tax=Sphingomonas vulcanisoli TaxID=1658060 RepID=A0ABX0TYE8_9SPHN|nr:hydantoinase/oxoprolinase family protein [Sphingomonas vulcanisoli]NIJ09229.1 N-methylhydantoinase A [Sphingomonas vulcanisoli]
MVREDGRYRIGVDVGGTHTDLVLLDVEAGTFSVEKVSSTPANPALGVLEGVSRFFAKGIDPADVGFFAHGTTITTNALLEMRGARVGLLITAGYRAVQEVQQQARDGNLFDYSYVKPAAIAPQSLTFEIAERTDYQGNVLHPLDAEQVREAARKMIDKGVESVAVCFLFSFMNPAHEEETRRILKEVAPDLPVSLSSEVLPRIREWPRLSTTLLNAYLEPVLVRYIDHLARGLDKVGVRTPRRFLMQSNGGVMLFDAAASGGRTVHTLLSGPAAGAQASAYLADEGSRDGLVTLDMGGTSADIAFIQGGVPLEVTEGIIDRRQIDVPSLDMTTISAGGGSIAAVSSSGFLTVGPRSAGAMPGPACYGRGGTQPTVTDADIVCGYLNPDNFLGGKQRLDIAAAREALLRQIGDPLGLDALEAAAGIRRIVDMRMADEVRVFAAKRGVELSKFTLLPFGGAGAVHAVSVAEELGITRVMVPRHPGAFSALGLLCTDVMHDYIKSELRAFEDLAPEYVEDVFRALEEKASRELVDEGLSTDDATFIRELDLRYAGQGYELRTPLEGLAAGPLDAAALAAARARFDDRHEQVHGHAAADRPVEVVSYRLRARVTVPKYIQRSEPFPVTPGDVGAAETGERAVYFDGKTAVKAKTYERERLEIGARLEGPAIIEQFDSTVVVNPGWRGRVDEFRNLIIERC